MDTNVRKCFICNKEWFFLEKRYHGIGVCGDGEYEESSESDHSGSSYDPPAVPTRLINFLGNGIILIFFTVSFRRNMQKVWGGHGRGVARRTWPWYLRSF